MYLFLWQPLLSCLKIIVSLERFIFWGLISKLVCEVCLLSGFQLQMGGKSKENHLLCHFINTSSFCLWEVSIAVIHGGIRSTSIENSFSIVLRLLKSQIWMEMLHISGMSIKFTFWKSRRALYCLIKYPAFASVKTYPPMLQLCWTVLSTSSI